MHAPPHDRGREELQPLPLDARGREILRVVVEHYLNTGSPVGSRNISRILPTTLSPATIRNAMSDLEHLGFLFAPHTSAGRMPTDLGLRFFVDTLLHYAEPARSVKKRITEKLHQTRDAEGLGDLLNAAGSLVSSLAKSVGVVFVFKEDRKIRHIEFVPIGPGEAIAILVSQDGAVENRWIQTPANLLPGALSSASNWMNHHLRGKTLAQARKHLEALLKADRASLDACTRELIRLGAGFWAGADNDKLIVRGQANLLKSRTGSEKIERAQRLMAVLEEKKEISDLLRIIDEGEGVRVFIGAESQCIPLSDSSVVAAPIEISGGSTVGVLGIIGPTRLNYGRVVPLVEFTAGVVSSLVPECQQT